VTSRKYSSGSRWAFGRRTEVGSYLTRLHLVKTPWFGVMLHWIHEPDPYPDPHDHSVTFWSLCLRGGYDEWDFGTSVRDSYLYRRLPCVTTHRSGQIRRISMHHVHSIFSVLPGTLTLAVHGRASQPWSYYASHFRGLSYERARRIPWRDYQKEHPLP